MRSLLILLLLTITAFAQQAPIEPAALQRVLATTQAQRNQLLDALNLAEARLSLASEDLTKAQTRIKELETKEKTDAKD